MRVPRSMNYLDLGYPSFLECRPSLFRAVAKKRIAIQGLGVGQKKDVESPNGVDPIRGLW